MSDDIPLELQAEIMKRLLIKSLIQFRSVSKPWKSLIDSPKFINHHTANHNINHHTANHNQPRHRHLLVRYKLNSQRKYISIIDKNSNSSNNDNDSFPQQQVSVTAPRTLSLLRHALVLGSSHGLLGFCGVYRDTDYETEMAVLWNPSVRKSVGIVIPNALYETSGYTVIGFGICPNTSDPKLVKVNHIVNNSLSESERVTREVEIFTLSSGNWRSISIKMPRTPIRLSWVQVVIDGVIYWQAYDKLPYDDDELRYNRIISFDLASEEFEEVYSDHLANATRRLIISKLMGSLVVLEDCIEDGKLIFVVWKMEHSVPKSFKKLFSIKEPDNTVYNTVLSFRKNGEPIMETIHDYEGSTTLQVYEHNAGRFKDLGIYGNGGPLTSCSVTSYRETLLLLDKPDSIIH